MRDQMEEPDRQYEVLRKEVERLREGLRALQQGKVDVVVNDENEISFIVPKSQIEQQDRELELLFDHMMNGFAYHQVVTDTNGLPIDYVFLRVNPAFEKMTGLTGKDVIGKRVSEVLPDIRKTKFDWIKIYGEVALTGQPVQFEQHFADPINEWYLISAYSPQTTYFAVVMKKITARKKAERALNELAKSLAKAQEIASLGNWEWDVASNTLKWSDEIYRIFGVSKNTFQVSYETFLDCVHPQDRAIVQDAVRAALENDKFYSLDHRIVLPDGSIRIVHEQAETVHKNGELTQLVGTVQDITERKQTEYELRKLSLAVEQSPATVVITDLNGIIEYVNPRFVEVTGYSAEEAIGQNPRILKSGKTPVSRYKELWDKIKSGKTWQGELINKKKNGQLFWENSLISPIKDSDDSVTHYIALKEDITKRKKAEEALDTWRIQYEKTIDALSTEVSLLNDKGEILFVNKACRDSAHQSGNHNCFRGEKGDNYFLICEEAARSNIPKAQTMLSGIRKILSGLSDTFTMQYTSCSPDQATTRWFVATVTFFESKEHKFLVVAHEDITNSVLREKAEADRQIAEKANQAKSEFLANMSHEIRTPLNGIVGFTQTALRLAEREKLTLEKCLEYFTKIRQCGQHLTQLINDILDLSKIEAGVTNVDMGKVDLGGVLGTIWSNFEQRATEKNLQLEISIPENLPPVLADRQKLSQVLINLIGNAVKFTENGEISITAFAREPDVLINVSDTGIGIPQEMLDEIFNKFSQVKGKQGEKIQGTGLGLTITRNLIRAMNGDIWVNSESGKGSTFSFNLKAAHEEK